MRLQPAAGSLEPSAETETICREEAEGWFSIKHRETRVKPTAAGKWTQIPDGNTCISWADTSRFSKLLYFWPFVWCVCCHVHFGPVPRDSTTTWSPWILRGRRVCTGITCPKARTLPRWSHGATQSCSGGSNDAAGIGLQGSSQGRDSAGGSWSPPVTHRKQSCLLYLSDAQLLVVLIVRTHIISLCVHY